MRAGGAGSRLRLIAGSRRTILCFIYSNKTIIYVFTLLKNRGCRKCQERYVSPIFYFRKLIRVFQPHEKHWEGLLGFQVTSQKSKLQNCECNVLYLIARWIWIKQLSKQDPSFLFQHGWPRSSMRTLTLIQNTRWSLQLSPNKNEKKTNKQKG